VIFPFNGIILFSFRYADEVHGLRALACMVIAKIRIDNEEEKAQRMLVVVQSPFCHWQYPLSFLFII